MARTGVRQRGWRSATPRKKSPRSAMAQYRRGVVSVKMPAVPIALMAMAAATATPPARPIAASRRRSRREVTR